MATAEFPRHAVSDAPDSSAAPAAELEKHLLRLAARRNRIVTLQTLVRALLPAAILSAIGTLLYRFFLLDGAPWMLEVLFAASCIVTIFTARMRRSGPFVAAREADRKWKLHDLLSSALALAFPQTIETPSAKWWQANTRGTEAKSFANSTPMVAPLIQQAARRAATIDARELYPFRFDRALQVLAIALLALGAFALMPDNPRFLSAQRRVDNAELKLQGEKLEESAKKAQEKKGLSNNTKASIAARKLEALAKRMQSGRMTRKEALLGMGELKRELQKAGGSQQSNTASELDIQRMREALSKGNFASNQAQKMQQELQQNRNEAAAAQMEKIAEKLQNPNGMSAEEKEKTARDLEEAARALRQQNNQTARNAAKQLEQAAKDLRNPQSQNNEQQSQQNQNQPSQNGQPQNAQQQNGQSQSGQQQSGQNSSSSGASDALNKMAQGLRNNGNSSNNDQVVRDMMKKIQEAEGNGQPGDGQQGQSGQGQQGESQQEQGQGQGKNNKNNGNGQSGSGEGQGDGRSGVTPGKDLKATDPKTGTQGGAGLGPRNKVQGGNQSGGGVSKLRSNKSNDDRRWEDVWSDRLPETQKKSTRVKGKMGNDGESERLQTKTQAKGGAAKTPYYDVYESYRRDAEDAISREDVPPAYQAPVKEYFDSINPN